MQHFWNTIIEPAFNILKPQNVVEIGVLEGAHTMHLLEYCKKNGAILHAIDPVPPVECAEWERIFSSCLIFHRDISTNVLPTLRTIDVVLIDGDHNWYTVYQELLLLEAYAKNSGAFPLVFLHDTGWPYARRDRYYAPERIPDAYRKPYAQKGMLPNSPALVDTGGLNEDALHSVEENTPQNGVLTAVEDFIRQSDQKLHLVQIPGLYGLSILLAKEVLEKNESFAEFIRLCEGNAIIARHIETMEQERISSLLQEETAHKAVKNGQDALKNTENILQNTQDALKNTEDHLAGMLVKMDTLSIDIQRITQSRSWRWTAFIRTSEKNLRKMFSR